MSARCCFCKNLASERDLSPALGTRFLARLRGLALPCHDVDDLEHALAAAGPGVARLCLDHLVGFEDERGGSITVRALLAAEEACESAGGASNVLEDPRAGVDGPAYCGHCGREVTDVEHVDNVGFCAVCAGSPS